MTSVCNKRNFFWSLLALLLLSMPIWAQTTSFTYQGKLSNNGNPANPTYDMQFKLFDALNDGNQVGATITNSNVAVANGVFTVSLDFGAGAFDGSPRFLEISVRPANDPNPYTMLSPRQSFSSIPYAMHSVNASAADGLSATCTGCVTNNQINTVDGAKVTGEIPTASVPEGSGNYIQNSATASRRGKRSLQQEAGFDIDGDGVSSGTLSGNFVNAVTQYNLGDNRLVSAPGTNNLFVGLNAAMTGPTGLDNTYMGNFAGNASTTGDANSFFGVSAGFNNQGTANSFFGRSAGFQNTAGSSNSFFGVQAGRDNTSGNANAFFGRSAGQSNSTGINNSFFGESAGLANTVGGQNAFFGTRAGRDNCSTGCLPGNGRGSSNAFFGAFAGASNTLGDTNSFFGASAGQFNTIGLRNSYFGYNAGGGGSAGQYNTAVGNEAGYANNGSHNTFIGSAADVSTGGLDHATAIGADVQVTASNRVQIGRIFQDTVAIGALTSSSSLHVCIDGNGVFANCSSSLRYKENIQPFTPGLNLLYRLRPVSFNWKGRMEPDLGLIAEEVAEVEPLLITHNQKGEVEGVKYDHLSVLFINAFKEQQAQIQQQQEQIQQQQLQLKQQQRQIEALTKLVCQQNPQADICK